MLLEDVTFPVSVNPFTAVLADISAPTNLPLELISPEAVMFPEGISNPVS